MFFCLHLLEILFLNCMIKGVFFGTNDPLSVVIIQLPAFLKWIVPYGLNVKIDGSR